MSVESIELFDSGATAPSLAVRTRACKPEPFDERDACVATSSFHLHPVAKGEGIEPLLPAGEGAGTRWPGIMRAAPIEVRINLLAA